MCNSPFCCRELSLSIFSRFICLVLSWFKSDIRLWRSWPSLPCCCFISLSVLLTSFSHRSLSMSFSAVCPLCRCVLFVVCGIPYAWEIWNVSRIQQAVLFSRQCHSSAYPDWCNPFCYFALCTCRHASSPCVGSLDFSSLCCDASLPIFCHCQSCVALSLFLFVSVST